MDLETILKMEQAELKKSLFSELRKIGYKKIFQPKGFVYAAGSVPVLLVAHLDTVHRTPVKVVCYSKDGNILMSPEGIGGDDRAGVYMVLEVIKEHKCHVLFCEDEECGGNGARLFASSRHKPDVNYIIEFDRRGSNDAVFYNCYNKEFTAFVCGHGFDEKHGTFSDISIIAPHLGIAAVNISAGYYNEHSRYETINMSDMDNNIGRAKQIVSAATERFKYIDGFRHRSVNYGGYRNIKFMDRRCVISDDTDDESQQSLYDSLFPPANER